MQTLAQTLASAPDRRSGHRRTRRLVQVAVDRLGGRGVAHGAGQAGRLQGPRDDDRRAARAQVRADPGAELAGRRRSIRSKITSIVPEGIGREGRRQDRRARSRAGGDAARRRDARTFRRRRPSSRRRSSTRRSTSRRRARTCAPPSTRSRKRSSRKEQAQYEAPTIKRQAEIDYEKAQRALEQSKRNLDTKTKQAVAKMSSRRRRPRPPAEQPEDHSGGA